jgi:hypothetical protein
LLNADEPLDRHEAPGHGVGGKEQALERNGAEQSRSLRRDQAGRCHLVAVQAKPHLGERPGFLSTPRRLDRTRAGGPQLESLGEGPGDDEKRGVRVHEKLDRLALARGAGQVRGNAE